MNIESNDAFIANRMRRLLARFMRKYPSRKLTFRQYLNKKGLRRVPKIFAIGFNKSATSSMHSLFESLSIPSFHQGSRSEGTWRPADDLRLMQSYDFFSDGAPFFGELEKLDALFPKSKYILQVRDLEGWVYSRIAHRERAIVNRPWKKLEPHTISEVGQWLIKRNNYHAYAIDYFSTRPDDFLIINFIRDAGATKKICNFVGLKAALERPDVNKNNASKCPECHTTIVQESFKELGILEEELGYDLLCPSLLSEADRKNYAADTSFLSQPEGKQ
jgi:hypothetical protein